MIYNIPHLNEETLPTRFLHYIKDKDQQWMYKLLLIIGPGQYSSFEQWNLKRETRSDLFVDRDKYAVVYSDIRTFLRDTEWCCYKGMGMRVLQHYFKEELSKPRKIGWD